MIKSPVGVISVFQGFGGPLARRDGCVCYISGQFWVCGGIMGAGVCGWDHRDGCFLFLSRVSGFQRN